MIFCVCEWFCDHLSAAAPLGFISNTSLNRPTMFMLPVKPKGYCSQTKFRLIHWKWGTVNLLYWESTPAKQTEQKPVFLGWINPTWINCSDFSLLAAFYNKAAAFVFCGCLPLVSGRINQAYLCNVSFNQHCLACFVPFDIICMQHSALCSQRQLWI